MNALEKETDSERRKLGLVQYFFIVICSGANREIIEHCHIEWSKYTSIGATVFFTGLLASLSGGYALYSVFQNTDHALQAAVCFGLLWGLVIFNLDRYIVSTIRKFDEKTPWRRLKELTQAFPRIILAALIALTISVPLEIKIFEDSLADVIEQEKMEAEERNKGYSERIHDIGIKNRKVSDKKEEIGILEQKLAEEPKIVKIYRDKLKEAEDKFAKTMRTNSTKMAKNKMAIEEIQNSGEDHFDEIAKYEAENKGLQREISFEESKVQNAKRELRAHEESYVSDIEREIKEARSTLRKLEEKEISARDSVEENTKEISTRTKNSFSNSFIPQLKALGILKKEDETMRLASLMLKLLFLAVELTPIFTKLITKRGAYDEIFERMDYEYKIEQNIIRSKITSEFKNHVEKDEELATKIAEAKTEKMLKANENIINEMAKKQEKLALNAINEWFKKENAKL
jgi:hypothetical protein